MKKRKAFLWPVHVIKDLSTSDVFDDIFLLIVFSLTQTSPEIMDTAVKISLVFIIMISVWTGLGCINFLFGGCHQNFSIMFLRTGKQGFDLNAC